MIGISEATVEAEEDEEEEEETAPQNEQTNRSIYIRCPTGRFNYLLTVPVQCKAANCVYRVYNVYSGGGAQYTLPRKAGIREGTHHVSISSV